MGNSRYLQFLFNKQAMMTLLEGNVAIGAAGAVGTLYGGGIASVTKLSTGTYKIALDESFNRYLGGSMQMIAPVTGANVNDGSFVVGTTYQITAVGTTDWAAVGLPSGAVAAVGQSFVATAIGGAGTGTAKAVGQSGILAMEIVGDPNVTVNQVGAPYMIVQCLDAAGAVANPASGSVLSFEILLRNSSVKGKGE